MLFVICLLYQNLNCPVHQSIPDWIYSKEFVECKKKNLPRAFPLGQRSEIYGLQDLAGGHLFAAFTTFFCFLLWFVFLPFN